MAGAEEIAGVRVVTQIVEELDAKALLELSDRVRQTLGDSVVVLGSPPTTVRSAWWPTVAPSVVDRGLKAGDMIRVAAQVAGGGGGGRDTMAQAGGRDPAKLPEAIAAARAEIEKALGMSRVLALDYGSARCGCAVSDPTGTIVTPLAIVEQPATKRGTSRAGRARGRARTPSASWSACR